MRLSELVRPWHGLAVLAGLMLAGCGSSRPEGNLPPETTATAEEAQASEDAIKANMGQIAQPGQ